MSVSLVLFSKRENKDSERLMTYIQPYFLISGLSLAPTLAEIFLQVTFHCVKGEREEGLTKEDFTSLGSPISHSLLEGYNLNMGNAELDKLSRHYPIIARLFYLERYSPEAKKTFLRYQKSRPDKLTKPLVGVACTRLDMINQQTD